jgi:hypothetical protein
MKLGRERFPQINSTKMYQQITTKYLKRRKRAEHLSTQKEPCPINLTQKN